MTNQEILEFNKRCAEFLGYKLHFIDEEKTQPYLIHNDKYKVTGGTILLYKGAELKFHSDWTWIMEVVEAIEKLKFNSATCTNSSPVFSIGNTNCYIYILNDVTEYGLGKGGKYYYWSLGNYPVFAETKKEAVIQAINKFLIWYNNELH